jgi:hypothetical protein
MPKRLFIGILFMILTLSLNSLGCGILNSNTTSSSVNNTSPALSNIAELEGMSVGMLGGLAVELKPINAKANTNYTIDLYEKGNLRASENIIWNQPEINVGTTKMVLFGLTADENSAYLTATMNNSKWWKPIFSIKIHEILPMTIIPSQSTITLTYPKGGEIWHVGDVVTITWTSTNLPKATLVSIRIWSSNFPIYGSSSMAMGKVIVNGIPNTGSYKWTVPNLMEGSSIIGTHSTVKMGCATADNYGSGGESSGEFTIIE